MRKKEVEEIKRDIKNSTPIAKERVEFISTGSTMLNLALSQKGINGGFARNRIINIVGDGSSGKTLIALETAHWVFRNIKKIKSKIFPAVDNIKIVYVNRERVMDFPVEKMYGQDFFEAVEWRYDITTIEEFGRFFGRLALDYEKGDCIIIILDSWDSMNSEAGQERFKQAALKDTPADGSYKTEKAAYASKEFFNNACDLMTNKDITLLIISQTRSKIGVTFGEKHYRSGGDALNFYTHQVPWLAEVEKLKKTFKGETRVNGVRMLAKIKRNKTAKPFRQAESVILFDYGVDNISSMINYLWGPQAKKITFDDYEFKTKEDLILYIEDGDLEEELSKMCEDRWREIEEAMVPERKRKF
jgi:recombination protein RecA